MSEQEDSPYQKLNPLTELSTADVARADGRLAPTQEEHDHEREQRELRAQQTLDEARRNLDAAGDPSDPEIQYLRSQLPAAGASATSIDTQTLERVAREAREKAEKEIQEKAATGVALLVGIGATMASMGVKNDGKNYSGAQLFTAAMMYDNSLPSKEQDGQLISY
jgi:hypothetical protein